MWDYRRLLKRILKGYTMPVRGFHGVVHWARVLENGQRIAPHSGANLKVVTLFALFHDSRRIDDGYDLGHGQRGADLAQRMRADYLNLTDEEFDLLSYACEWHTDRIHDRDVTVQTCWDADRLDLGRVGMVPSLKYLQTEHARDPKTIEWAHQRAVDEHEPDFVVSEWGIPPRAY